MKNLNFKKMAEMNIVNVEVMNEEKKNMDMEKLSTMVRAMIDGQEIEFIPAFTHYSMEQPKKKNALLKNADAEKRMDVIFHFATPEIFWNEDITLFDRNGDVLPKGKPNVLPVCDMADTHWRLFLDEVLTNVQVHEFESVAEYAQTIGNSMLLSRGLNNVEKVGYAAMATGNEAYKTVFEFSKRNGVPMNTAQLYLDLQLKPVTTQLMLLGKEPKTVPTLGRTVEVAQNLYEQCRLTFGDGEVKKRYVGRAVNSILKQEKFSLELVMEALRTIPASDVAYAKLMDCGTKEACIAGVLISWIIDMQRKQAA